ncbi:MAG: hypothetical protein AB8B56_12220 [Crocinitomicaceae bacterium]
MEELLDNPEHRLNPKKRKVLSVLVVATVVLYVIGTLASFYSIRTILYAGPVIAVAGVIVIIAGLIQKEKIAVVFGSFAALSVSGIALMIFIFEISPRQARPLIPYFGVMCLMALVGLTIWFFMSLRKRYV